MIIYQSARSPAWPRPKAAASPVKPHGALNNQACEGCGARRRGRARSGHRPGLILLAPVLSELNAAGARAGLSHRRGLRRPRPTPTRARWCRAASPRGHPRPRRNSSPTCCACWRPAAWSARAARCCRLRWTASACTATPWAQWRARDICARNSKRAAGPSPPATALLGADPPADQAGATQVAISAPLRMRHTPGRTRMIRSRLASLLRPPCAPGALQERRKSRSSRPGRCRPLAPNAHSTSAIHSIRPCPASAGRAGRRRHPRAG